MKIEAKQEVIPVRIESCIFEDDLGELTRIESILIRFLPGY